MPREKCQAEACKIQDCLQANNYQEDKCKEVFEAMVRCCERYQFKNVCCAGFRQYDSTASKDNIQKEISPSKTVFAIQQKNMKKKDEMESNKEAEESKDDDEKAWKLYL